MGSALIHINNAISRHVVDVNSNVISAIGCLIVVLLMNAAISCRPRRDDNYGPY
jgi:hypothetical protein